EEIGDQTLGQARPVLLRGGTEPGIGQHHHRQIADDEVDPEHSGLLRPVDEVGELGFGPTSPVSDGSIRPLRGEERFGEPAIGDLHASDLGDETAEPPPRIGVGHRLRQHGFAMVDLRGEHLGDEASPIGKPSEQCRSADSGPPGDRVHRHVESALGEQLLRRGEDPPTIRIDIRTQTGRAGGVDLSRLGHLFSHFPRKRNGYSTCPLSLSGKPVPEQAERRADGLPANSRRGGKPMRILMFGRGVIATQYGWALEQAGHEVDFYVRPGRAATYGPFVDLDILDGRARGRNRRISHRWPLTMREDLDSNHDYELIILSVNHDQLPTAVEFLSSRLGDAALLIFNNVWDDPRDSAARLPAGQVVWGFPGGGGGFAGSTLRGGMLRSLTLGLLDGGPPTAAHTRVHELLTGAGF